MYLKYMCHPSKKPSLVPSGSGSVPFQFRPVPVPSRSVTFFTSTFTSTEVPLKMTVFLHKCSNRIHKELIKWSEIWHEHRPIYGTDSWLRKFGGPAVFCIFEHQGVHLDNNGIYQTVAKVLLNP